MSTVSNVTEDLADWANNEPNVPRSSVHRLLKVLKPHLPSLPLSVNTLMPPGKHVYEEMEPGGKYVHFNNWLEILSTVLDINKQESCHFTLKINIDGLPLFKSSANYKLYPILALIDSINCRPICIGIYSSEKSINREMPSPEIILSKLMEDLDHMRSEPIQINDNKVFTLENVLFICDAPARSSLKKIVHHTGYNSCERCKVKGLHYDHRVSIGASKFKIHWKADALSP